MVKMNRSDEKTQDKVSMALERVVDKAVNGGGEAAVYMCSLTLPKQFAQDNHAANGIYKRIQSDFCKGVMRSTGHTPRYVTVKMDNDARPEYAFCLFTHKKLDKPEEYAERGRTISNGKASQAGWGRGTRDIVELFKDAPRFTIASQPITLTHENKETVMPQLYQHLQGKEELGPADHQRTLFVSKCQ